MAITRTMIILAADIAFVCALVGCGSRVEPPAEVSLSPKSPGKTTFEIQLRAIHDFYKAGLWSNEAYIHELERWREKIMTPQSGAVTGELLERRWRKLGYEQLLPEERCWIMLRCLWIEMREGGLDAYFVNPWGDNALQLISALKELGALETHHILQEAVAFLDAVGGYSSDCETRRQRLGRFSNLHEAFWPLTVRLREAREDAIGMALERVARIYQANETWRLELEEVHGDMLNRLPPVSEKGKK